MFCFKLKCPKGHTTTEVEWGANPCEKWCPPCDKVQRFEPIDIREIGECEACRDPYELDWECPDEPHHGSETECGECNATYYKDFGGEIYTTNEQAKKNFPELKTL